MKYWKCPECAYLKETNDNIKIAFCKCCLRIMEEHPYEFKKEVVECNNRGEHNIISYC